MSDELKTKGINLGGGAVGGGIVGIVIYILISLGVVGPEATQNQENLDKRLTKIELSIIQLDHKLELYIQEQSILVDDRWTAEMMKDWVRDFERYNVDQGMRIPDPKDYSQ